MLTVLPPFGARKASQSSGVTLTSLPFSDQFAFQLLDETDSVSPGS